MKIFALNEGQKRRKKKKKKTFKNKNRCLKSSIYEIISLLIKLITILELAYLHSRLSFWHCFLFYLAILVYDYDNMHQKIKFMAEIWNPFSLKHGFITPSLTGQ